MPRFKGSCGCYNRQDARELGLTAAIVWNDMLDRSEHFDANPMWYDQKSAAERLGIPERTMNRAVERLVEAGRITKKRGYRPETTIQTTWVTILAEEDDSVGGFRNDDLAVSRNDDLAVSILKETKKRDLIKEADKSGFLPLNNTSNPEVSILPCDKLIASISHLVREHNNRSEQKLFFNKNKIESGYSSLKEKLETVGLDLGKKEVEQIFKEGLKASRNSNHYLFEANQAEVFFHPNNIHNFLRTGSVKEYTGDEAKAIRWIINHGYADSFEDFQKRKSEILCKVQDIEEYQAIILGVI